jgi:hypothetical protein
MSVLLALVLLFVGWLLGFGQQAWRDRHEAQLAARLLAAELLQNQMELATRASGGSWDEINGISHRLWETYGVVVLRIMEVGLMQEILLAQFAVDHAAQLADTFVKRVDQRRMTPEAAREEYQHALDNLETSEKAAVEQVSRRVEHAIPQLIGAAHESFARFIVRKLKEGLGRFSRKFGRKNGPAA